MNEHCHGRWKSGLIMLLLTPVLGAAEGNFRTDIQQLAFSVRRDKESLVILDKLGEDLLHRYQQPQQQGEIYYYLAHQHAQGGLLFPRKVIEYACRALELPITPDQRMRLCVYRGDAIQVSDRSQSFSERRKKALGSYLQGLGELKRFQLPDTPPKIPNTAPKPLLLGAADQQDKRRAQRQFEEEQRQYLEARERAQFTRTMMKHRDVLQGQIVAMYGRRPVATEELKELATNILGEGKELDRLMTAVNERVAILPPETKPAMMPIEAAAPEMPSKYLYLGIALGVGAVMAVILLLLVRRSRAKGGVQSKPAQ